MNLKKPTCDAQIQLWQELNRLNGPFWEVEKLVQDFLISINTQKQNC
jgi:hypothetical protein